MCVTFQIKISGGLFKEGLDIVSLGNTSLVFYGDLELVLLDQWIDEYKSFAEYSIEGSLRDGSSLSAPISCTSWTPLGRGGALPWGQHFSRALASVWSLQISRACSKA